MTIYSIFGKRMRIVRKQRHLTQEQIAERTGFSNTYICEIEHGKKRIILETAQKIADALDVPLSELLKDIPAKSDDYTLTAPNLQLLLESSGSIRDSLLILQNFMQELTENNTLPPHSERHPKN